MPIINYSQQTKLLRHRKNQTQEQAAEEMGYHAVSLSRMETGAQLPRSGRIPHDALSFPLLGATPNALNRSQQFLLMEQNNCPPAEMFPLIDEALRQLNHTPLLFEEVTLLHLQARTYQRAGNLPHAIKLLQSLQTKINDLPTWDKDKERQQVPVLLTLARCQLQARQYEDTIQTCERGFHLSATRCQASQVPDFMYLQAQAMYALGREGFAPLLRNAYFCYSLMHKKDAAEEVLQTAESMGVTINTYGVDTLQYTPRPTTPYAHDSLANYKSIGGMIRTLRKKSGFTLMELAQGICSKTQLQKIESDAVQGKLHHLEPLMQRLGRDVHLYVPFYFKQDDFLDVQMRENINTAQIVGDYAKSAELLDILKQKKEYKDGANLQFIKRVEANIFHAKNGSSHPHIRTLFEEAMKITCPQFNEMHIDKYPLTHTETILINLLAIHYGAAKDFPRTLNIFKCLLENMKQSYTDETEKSRMFSAIIFNYSQHLGRAGQRHAALGVVEEGITYEQDRGRLFSLPELTYIKAYNLYEIGKKDESLPYFVQAYYGVTTLLNYGFIEHQKIAARVVSERFGIVFE
ncbi:MAG: hypothetical protein FWC16_08275 [Defluviitaleaceae bacterium]|nr:hypothetical protein [Defluviitaleaceae bacterium]MCL2274906.1 hypothetical protein [Defluviitaleaceae bacterium]